MTTTIWERTATALTSLTVPVAANVYISPTPGVWPDTFVVYQLVSSVPEQHADEAETLRSYRMQVSVFARSLIGLPGIDALMVAAGFARGPLRELPYDETTRHYGQVAEYVYLEQE